jgi:hypothetical protein
VMLLYSLIQEMQFLATTLPSLSERALWGCAWDVGDHRCSIMVSAWYSLQCNHNVASTWASLGPTIVRDTHNNQVGNVPSEVGTSSLGSFPI